MNAWHQLISSLPFEWTQFAFMRTALLAVLIVSPLFALMGTLVVNNRMAFFSDAIGHASLTGVGLGVLLGLANPLWALVAFALVLGVGIIALQRFTRAAMDTVISLSMSFSIALGVVLLSRGGNFNKFSHYLIGDLLSITPGEVGQLLGTSLLVGGALLLGYNRILLIGFNESLARSRGMSGWWTQMLFCTAVVNAPLNWLPFTDPGIPNRRSPLSQDCGPISRVLEVSEIGTPSNQPAGISLRPGSTVTCSFSALDSGAAVCWERIICEE